MNATTSRRRFLTQSLGAVALSALPMRSETATSTGEVKRRSGTHVKLALNAYSFNRPLIAGTMTLYDVIDYCTAHDVDGVDLTGYYFPGYPNAPSDEYIYSVKKHAYFNGVTIQGTGVRNDFALPEAADRKGQIQLVKVWIDVAAKLGASFVRAFSGREAPRGFTFDQVLPWMVPAFQECAQYGKARGVVVGLQHHDDFLKTADQTIRLVKEVGSEWFSVVLDVGSLRQGDPYEEIERLLPYACTWQLKENVWYGQKATPIDLARVRAIIERVGFRGFLPIEALAPGEPTAVVTDFLNKVRKAFA